MIEISLHPYMTLAGSSRIFRPACRIMQNAHARIATKEISRTARDGSRIRYPLREIE